MQKFFSVFLILFLFCCHKTTLDNDIVRINNLHQKAKSNVNDSTLMYIKEAKDLIDKNNKLPDTLKIENIFRKGYYYKQINNLDSAAYYFHRTIDRIKAPNNRQRNLIYYRNTWETDVKLDNYANGISVAKKFINITNDKTNSKDLVYAFNFLERAYLDLQL